MPKCPSLSKPYRIVGKNLVFRNATPNDAEFILSLRIDPEKSKYLSKVSGSLQDQIVWLNQYATDETQVYFVIEDMLGGRLGTVRLYDQQQFSFCWGSWILKGERPSGSAMESALMVYSFALELGFVSSHFDVRKGNESVWQFHERFGAKRRAETALDYLYSIDKDGIESGLERYRRFLPHGIAIEWREEPPRLT